MFKWTTNILFLAFFVQSCSYFNSKLDEDKNAIAKVRNTYLYQEDIESILPKKYTAEDSTILVSNFINTWAKQQLLFQKAKINLQDSQEEIKKLVAKYEQDLLINKYKEAVVSQELNTVINDSDIENFYNENKDIFLLSEKLIKLRFIQMSNNNLEVENTKELFKSFKNEDITELNKNELTYKSFYYNDTTWIKYSDVMRLLPIMRTIESNINKGVLIFKKDSLDLFLIKINDLRDRNMLAPKSYVEPTIRQMILHKRKLKVLKNIEKTLLNDATKNGKYEIYK